MKALPRLAIAVLSACALLSSAAAASAQTKPAEQGPLVLEPTSDGPVLAPEVKFVHFEEGGGYGTFVGGYGGWLFDDQLLLGGGVSFLLGHGYGDKVSGMGYGGFLAGWTAPVGGVLRVGLRGLVGFGQAELIDSFTYPMPVRYSRYPDSRHGAIYPPYPSGGTFRFWDDFFIFEPQGTAIVHLARGVAVEVAGGYRVIAGLGPYNGWLRGFSGSVAVRVGPKL